MKKARQPALIAELIAEAAGAFMGNRAMSWAMQHGTETEDEARKWYEMDTGIDSRTLGFVLTDDGRFGASPDLTLWEGDAIVGGAEIKCPDPKTHAAWLITGKVPAKHVVQVHGSMIVCGTKWWEFFSYCKGADLPKLRIRVERDEFTDLLAAELERFYEKLQAARRKLIPGVSDA